ncbi:zinc finger, CCHC-type containing protein [Tanacetum coccineum]
MVPLRSDTIRFVQNGCSFHGLWPEDPNQHLMDFLKLVDSIDLDGENRERTRMRLFQFSLHGQASNWLERLPAGSITTWEDLTTSFLAQFFPPGRTAKFCYDILMFQQHQRETLSEAWTRFKDLLQKVPHHGIDLWLQICSGPHDTQYCMKDPEQAFVEYASSRIDEPGERDGDPEDTNTIAYNEEQRDTPLLEQKDITVVEEPLDLVDTSEESAFESFIKEMPKCSLNYDFKIKKGDPRSLQIPCMIGHKFTANAYIDIDLPMNVMSLAYYNSIRKNEYGKDDYDRGCRKPSDLEEGFYRDTIKLGPEYVTGLDDEGEVTLYLTRRSSKVLRKFHWTILGGRFNQLSHVSSSLLSKPGEY